MCLVLLNYRMDRSAPVRPVKRRGARAETGLERKKRETLYPFILYQHCMCVLEFNFRRLFENVLYKILPANTCYRLREKITHVAIYNFQIHMRFDCPPAERDSKRDAWVNLSVHEALKSLLPQFQFCVPPPKDICVVPAQIANLPSSSHAPYSFTLHAPVPTPSHHVPTNSKMPQFVVQWHSQSSVPIIPPHQINQILDLPHLEPPTCLRAPAAPAQESLLHDQDDLLSWLPVEAPPGMSSMLDSILAQPNSDLPPT